MKKEEIKQEPLWFKHAVIYQLHVKGFYDLNEDGIGDFAGLTDKISYLKSLGITAVWLLPFYPSPLKDDGYDISDYFEINAYYGKHSDFRRFLRIAHQQGIRVITELVINHTSDQHPWFERARHAKPGSVWRDFYVWSNTPSKYKDARIIFQDFESSNWTWDPVAKAYFWHRFYAHQPDLNFANPHVQKEVFRILDFWFEMGVDGLRLDAIPYLFEQEGTNCENLEATHEFAKKLRQHVDSKFKDKVLIAEANQWPEDAVAYFGKGDECHMAFHFPVMPRLFMAIHMENRFPIVDILEQTPVPPPSCQWIMFLRNHDELTLEMVSDEERDYMYRIYAKDPKARINLGIRRRLAPLLDNDRAKIELMNILLLSLPGTPVIYYGDEIGMGDNYYLGDRNGVRTPMQWSSDRNAGFSRANPQKLYLPTVIDPPYHYEIVNVENQERNPSSLLWWFRRVLAIYKNHPTFGFGSLEFLVSRNPKLLAFTRTYQEDVILVVINLSRFPQASEFDLSKYAGYTPHEIFHQNPFPSIKEVPYNITLGPYNYFWLSLKPSHALKSLVSDEPPKITIERHWKNIFKGNALQILEKKVLPYFLKRARWFERKACTIQAVNIASTLSLGHAELCLLQVEYLETEEVDTYLLPLSFAPKQNADQILSSTPQSFITYVQFDGQEGILYDSIYSETFRNSLLQLILKKRKLKIESQELMVYAGEALKKELFKNAQTTPSIVFGADQSNSSMIFGQHFFLKLYRKLEEGIHPEFEMNRFLSDQAKFTSVPAFLGAIEWNCPNHPHNQPMTIALLEEVIPNEGSGWTFSLDALSSYYEQILTLKGPASELIKVRESLQTGGSHLESLLAELIGGNYLEAAQLLGKRTAELHLALLSQDENPHFSPESCSILYQHSLYQALRSSIRTTFHLLKEKASMLPEDLKPLIIEIQENESEVLNYLQRIHERPLNLARMRIHGDYHLGQVLFTGKDFCLIDFEGQPLQSLTARRIKRFPLQDVAGMIHSFYYAAHKALSSQETLLTSENSDMESWANVWYETISAIFLQSYMEIAQRSSVPIISQDLSDYEYLLQVFILDKAFYELSYELQTRPDWVPIACKGICYSLKNKISLKHKLQPSSS